MKYNRYIEAMFSTDTLIRETRMKNLYLNLIGQLEITIQLGCLKSMF